jgi:hypothetical protein
VAGGAAAADERRGALLSRVGNLESMLQALVTQAQAVAQAQAERATSPAPAAAPAAAAPAVVPAAAAAAIAALGPGQARSAAGGASAGKPRAGDGALRPLEQSQLSARQVLRLDFARRVAAALHSQAGKPAGTGTGASSRGAPQLVAAASFPAPAPERATFFDLFFYDTQSHTLYVRSSELEAAGDLLMSLAHALATVAVSPDDLSASAAASPAVLVQLNKNLTALAAEFFRQHADNSAGAITAQAGGGDSTTQAGSPPLVQRAPSLRHLTRGSSRSLLSPGPAAAGTSATLGLGSPSSGSAAADGYFAPTNLDHRLRRYNSALRVLGAGSGSGAAASPTKQ